MADAYVTLVAVQPTVAVRSGARQKQASTPQASLGTKGGVFETLRNRQILRGDRGRGGSGIVTNNAPTVPTDVVFTSPAARSVHLAIRLPQNADTIVLYWSASPGFNRHEWQRQEFAPYEGLATLDITIAPGIHYFAAAAKNDKGESPISDISRVSVSEYPLPAPAGLFVRPGTLNRALFLWEKVPGATSYTILHAGLPNLPAALCTKVEVTHSPHVLRDLVGGRYFFRIVANGPWGAGEPSPEQEFLFVSEAPTGLFATNTRTGVHLTWEAPATQNAIARYRVYRSATENGEYAFLADTADATAAFHDETVAIGQTFFYKVAAHDTGHTVVGAQSSSLSVTRAAYTLTDADTVALYRFENDLTDKTGAHNLTPGSTAPTYAAGQHGNGVFTSATGTSRAYKTMDAAFGNIIKGDVTIEGWVRWNTGAADAGFPVSVMTDGNTSTAYRWLCLMLINGTGGRRFDALTYDGADTQASSNTVVVAADTWAHFAIRRKLMPNGKFKMDVFVGGALVGTNANCNAINPTGTTPRLSIGGNGSSSSTGNKHNGGVDSLRISRRARTDREIADYFAASAAEFAA